MNRLWPTALITVGITACATHVPDSPPSVSTTEEAVESSAPSASDVVVVSDSVGAATSAEAGITNLPAHRGLVCKRERRTGSHRARKVCRTRAQIAQEELAARETFEDLHRSQQEYD